ncbi:hypothetical protein RM700_053 [Saccharomyces cerevisiae synthetic construct]|uniref:Putative uncharacterized protein YKL169C n=2 Tax=Saccharomyces cerevisiae TaxID=4932 RepID=YKQ9_YEAST|nr:RecName: Full=Putative uncharacterized protein YKL169C [Saccharomyces cerevisiae S288C]AAT93330.1 YKL169C [Saccharomyces cerevisiae]WNV94136.1 hypothetical protein RM700_053 [Saccharomyces cerevisiae synthetic construct]CAY80920.1 EC1118_1K5_0551p [Saccharomyces cerevisiae EC1118]CAA81518.1 unknown [Saccharomyces cerevisiae]CAA82012.1 unnamed protein product [Saccharomyces cerevisiae]
MGVLLFLYDPTCQRAYLIVSLVFQCSIYTTIISHNSCPQRFTGIFINQNASSISECNGGAILSAHVTLFRPYDNCVTNITFFDTVGVGCPRNVLSQGLCFLYNTDYSVSNHCRTLGGPFPYYFNTFC